jgi:hypothetical protein
MTGPTVIAWGHLRLLMARAAGLVINGTLIGPLATTRARMMEEHPTTVSGLLRRYCLCLICIICVSITLSSRLFSVVDNESQWLYDEQEKCCETVSCTFARRLTYITS